MFVHNIGWKKKWNAWVNIDTILLNEGIPLPWTVNGSITGAPALPPPTPENVIIYIFFKQKLNTEHQTPILLPLKRTFLNYENVSNK